MTEDEHQDDRLVADAFRSLDARLRSQVDTEVGLADLRARSGRRRRTPWLIGAAAAVVLALGAGSVVVWSGGADRVEVVDGPTSTTTPLSDCALFVYLDPTATPEQIDALAADVARSTLVRSYEYLDQTETFEEFRRRFAGQTEFVESIRQEDLPTSFAVVASDGDRPALAEEFEQRPGVYRVESPPGCDGGTSEVEPGESGGEPTSTTTTVEAPVPWSQREWDLSGTVTFVRSGTGTGCPTDADTTTTASTACPDPGDPVVGTMIVGDVMVVVPESADLEGCEPRHDGERMTFDHVASWFTAVPANDAVAQIWSVERDGPSQPQLVLAEAVVFGDCG